jgi:two-component system sensor kinase FixL
MPPARRTAAERSEDGPGTTANPTEVRLRAILAGMLDPVVTIDARGIVQEASASVQSVFGWEPAELIGRNVNVLMGEPQRSLHDGYLARYRETGVTNILGRTREFEVVHKNGTQLVCELSVSRVDVPGEPDPLFIGSFRDVTARRKAELALADRERRLSAVFDQEFEFVALLSPAGEVLEVNRAALEAVGAERAEVVGKPFWETPWWEQTAGARELVQRSIADAVRGELVRFETTLRGVGGRRVTVDFSLKPVRNERGELVLLLPEGRDITVLRDAQRRETSMLKALATIGESASVLVHEIKSPITGIHLALQAVADQLGEDTREILQGLEASLRRVERTMRRTLSFAKPLELERRSVAPERLLQSLAARARTEYPRSTAALEIECADVPLLEADEGLLEDALWNLVKNSLEALEFGGHVRLTARRTGNGKLELAVEDDGPGIPDYVLPNVFKPFYTTKATGTGIGLALCKKIVDAHGGEIRAGRGSLGGAGFTITLPLA